jgi:hypothetical protein
MKPGDFIVEYLTPNIAIVIFPFALLSSIALSDYKGVGIDIILVIVLLCIAQGLWTLKPWAFWGAAIMLALNAPFCLYIVLVQCTSPYAILLALFFSLGGLIYLFANRKVRAAFFNT